MKRIYLVLIVLIGITISCTKNFEDFNTDQKHPADVTGNTLLTNAQKALTDIVASTNVNHNIWKMMSQYWTETTYTDEANYDIVNRTIADITFRDYYRDVLLDLDKAKTYIEGEVYLTDTTNLEIIRRNRLAVVDILMVYCYQDLVNIFGNVPYTEALDIENLSPAYDDAFTIYKDLLIRLDVDIPILDNTLEGFGSADLYYSGDNEMWVKFANTLKVRMGIMLADVDAALSKKHVEEGYIGAFSPGENCQLNYPGGTNSNPLYVDLIASGRHDFVPANTIIDIMNGLLDPRRSAYFTMIDTSSNPDVEKLAYVGGSYGYSNSYGANSHIAAAIQEPDYPMVMLDYTELAFYLAEAAERGFAVGNNAEYYYNEGIKSSFLHWGLPIDSANAYLAKPEIAYTTAPGTWKQKIGLQAWLAFYIRGLEGYNSWRKLDYPILNLPPSPNSDDGQVPKRFTYPVNEQTLNAANYYQAADAIGGDLMSTRIFWDLPPSK
jgi:hypothetical protein